MSAFESLTSKSIVRYRTLGLSPDASKAQVGTELPNMENDESYQFSTRRFPRLPRGFEKSIPQMRQFLFKRRAMGEVQTYQT